VKIGPVDPEIALLDLKKKKLTQAKYIARSAGLPSGLNNYLDVLIAVAFFMYYKCALACGLRLLRLQPVAVTTHHVWLWS